MGWFDAFQDSHDDVHNNGSLTHDALAGAVAYEAAKAYENHVAKNGQPDSHAKAKELLAAAAAAAITHLAETRGRDAWDEYKERQVRERADEHIETILTERYN